MEVAEDTRRNQKPKYNMWQNVCYMIRLAWCEKEKKVLVLGLLVALLTVLSNLINLYISPTVLAAVERKSSIGDFIFTIMLFVGAMMFCSAALSYVNANTLFGRVSLRMVIVGKINKKAAVTSYPNTEDDEFIKLTAKAAKCADSNSGATEAVWNTIVSLLYNSIGFIIYIILLSSVHVVMVIIILVTSIIGYFVSKYVSGYQYRHRDEAADYENKMWYISNMARDYNGAKDIRIFGMKSWFEEVQSKILDSYMSFYRRAEGIYIWAKITDLIMAFLRNGIAYGYLIHLVLSNHLTASQFLLYFSAVGGFTTWVMSILENLVTLHRQSLDLTTVRECLEYPECFRFEEGEHLLPDNRKKYEIRLENVSFRYLGAKEDTLSHMNLTLHPGEKLAVVGVNGAGKTTLVKLLCGLLEPTKGRVLLNGRDIREYNRRDYYCMFSGVFQQFSLIAGTIGTNIAQREEGIDRSKMERCAKIAGLEEKIQSLPRKYDTHLNREVYEDAVMLSGGELQRLMLARALYKDAPIVLLDEPTAALDPIAEAQMYQKYNELTRGRTSVYISHRLASTRFCNRIILLDNGGIAEEGTHDELMKLGGAYAKMFAVQSKYYQEGEVQDEK